MNLTCIIVDDEPLAIRLLENFVERTPFLVLKASFTDSISALQTIKNDVVDLLFLDIQMPDLNGMELSRMVPSRTRIIFAEANTLRQVLNGCRKSQGLVRKAAATHKQPKDDGVSEG